MKIKREEIIEDIYREIFDKETHHDHEIEIVNGVYRWVENKNVSEILENISLNDLLPLLKLLGYDKNSEIYRKLYRDMGYSLHGYWEVFYCKINNEDSDYYNPNLNFLNEQEFYDAMQQYRISPINNQMLVIESFENVKKLISNNILKLNNNV